MKEKQMSREQLTYLVNRLSNMRHKALPETKVPANIQKAMDLVKQFNADASKARSKVTNEWAKKYCAVQEVVFSGKYDEALAAIKKLEADYTL